MSLFQKSVEQKYLKHLDSKLIETKFNEFKTYFSNPVIQENIRNSKEEQFQEGFLRELFVRILGYTLNPSPDFNLTTEYKNIKDSKKADGAIIVNSIVKGIIELKGTDTTDLSKVESQAFGYKNNQTDCVYIITSNFEKLRFYIDNAIEHIEFNLFTLTKQDFEILFLCLAYDSIAKGTPKKIKDESVSHEDKITKELYRDYSVFKNELYQNLVKLNPQVDSLTLYKKSQKLLDRFLFLFFAEDRNLLPPNSVRLVLNDWKELIERDEVKPLYDRFKKYFEYLNTGYKGKRYDVFAYNGGLFKPDEILDRIIIDDDLLYKHTLKLSEYDFVSEVDVNILGHIFENSLNELDALTAQQTINDGVSPVVNSSVSKRKKDGVFYTPKYITKYIVENTVGKLCLEKKAELQINEEDYTTDKKRQLKTRQALLEKLNVYSNWLLQLTICDPACGSGAFLNQALDFLISEHRYIDELKAKLYGVPMILSDIEKSILENNLFGVDLNEESVEIAKLSLWLRTAQPNRKLNDLNNNIKCGNSLIDDPAIAGDKAFNWQKEFPNVFIEKEKKARHITWVTHNSRTSQRMIDNHVRKGEAFWIDSDTEIFITQCIRDIVIEDGYNVLEYNICGDHIHMLLVCSDNELPNIVRKLKGKSSQRLKEKLQIPKEEEFHLWAQKFSETYIDSDNQFYNTIAYIARNREKHQLAFNNGLQPIVQEMTCTYDHAFRTEYTGGFDVVIGNPPYVFARDNFQQKEKDFYVKNFISSKYQINTYLLFIEKTVRLIKHKGVFGLIIPNSWLMVYSGESLRKFLLDNCKLNQIINLKGYSFESANVETVILIAEKECVKNDNFVNILLNNGTEFYFSHAKNQIDFSNNEGQEFKVFLDDESNDLNLKIIANSDILDNLVEIKAGLQAYEKDKGVPRQSAEDVINRPYDYSYKFDENTHKYLDGKDVGRYFVNWSGQYLRYGNHLAAPRTFNLFNGRKIIVREITGVFPRCLISTFSDEIYLYNRSNIAIIEKENSNISLKYIISILNSTLISYYFLKNTAKSVRKLFPKIILNDLRKFPIKKISPSEQLPFIEKADQMLSLNKELQLLVGKFQRTIQRRFTTMGCSPLSPEHRPLSPTMGCSPLLSPGQPPLSSAMGCSPLQSPDQPPLSSTMGCSPLLNADLRPLLTPDLRPLLTPDLRPLLTPDQPPLQSPDQPLLLSAKLQSWYLLSYPEFIAELGKKKIKLSLSDEAEWEAYFLQESKKALELKAKIETTDKEIDQMVYKLYGLTQEEIGIVENS